MLEFEDIESVCSGEHDVTGMDFTDLSIKINNNAVIAFFNITTTEHNETDEKRTFGLWKHYHQQITRNLADLELNNVCQVQQTHSGFICVGAIIDICNSSLTYEQLLYFVCKLSSNLVNGSRAKLPDVTNQCQAAGTIQARIHCGSICVGVSIVNSHTRKAPQFLPLQFGCSVACVTDSSLVQDNDCVLISNKVFDAMKDKYSCKLTNKIVTSQVRKKNKYVILSNSYHNLILPSSYTHVII